MRFAPAATVILSAGIARQAEAERAAHRPWPTAAGLPTVIGPGGAAAGPPNALAGFLELDAQLVLENPPPAAPAQCA